MSDWYIFRKSSNTNSFGLRGYWEYNPDTGDVRDFGANQLNELNIGDKITDAAHVNFELLEHRGVIRNRAGFEAALPFKIEHTTAEQHP